MTDQDPLVNCLQPCSLVMRASACFYCGETCAGDYRIQWTLGIRYCGQHKSWAIRDCRAYMHENKVVKVRDALEDPRLSELLQYFLHDVHVLRTNGVLEGGWKLNQGTVCDPTYFAFVQDKWSIPMTIASGGMHKNVYMPAFLNPAVLQANPGFPPDIADRITSAITILTEGFYKADYSQHLRLLSPGAPTTVEELPEVGLYKTADGRQVRVWVATGPT